MRKLIDPSSSHRLQRVCLVSETFSPEVNGVANTLKFLVDGMQTQGIEVLLIRPRQHAHDHTREMNGLKILTVPGLPIPGYAQLKFGLPLRRRIQRALRAFNTEALYIATEGPLGLASLRAAKRLGLPVLSGFHTNFHQYFEHYRLGFLRNLVLRYLRSFHNATAGTLVPTHFLAETLSTQGFRNTQVMARGVNADLFSPQKRCVQLRASWGAGEHDPVMIYVGRIAHEKNIQLAITSAAAFKQVQPAARFVVVGDGPVKDALVKAHPEVIFTGEQSGEELARHYASADIFLFPSLTDTYGNVVLEAMASGLHVLAFNYAAAGSLIRCGENGSLAAWQNEADFISQCQKLAGTHPFAQALRLQARLTSESLGWDKISEQFIAHLTLITEAGYDGTYQKSRLVPKV
jgi:glycosyltransferase involved in cell wall biosynthesis